MKADNVGMESQITDYKGRSYSRFYPAKDAKTGPGWYVFGRNPEYGDTLIMLCGRPAVAPRHHPHYNGKIRRGWPTKALAQYWADVLNRQSRKGKE